MTVVTRKPTPPPHEWLRGKDGRSHLPRRSTVYSRARGSRYQARYDALCDAGHGRPMDRRHDPHGFWHVGGWSVWRPAPAAMTRCRACLLLWRRARKEDSHG